MIKKLKLINYSNNEINVIKKEIKTIKNMMSEMTTKLLTDDMTGQCVNQGEGVIDCTMDFQCEKCKSTFSTEITLNKCINTKPLMKATQFNTCMNMCGAIKHHNYLQIVCIRIKK